MVKPGLEVLAASTPPFMRGRRVGLVTNQAAVDKRLTSAADLLAACRDFTLCALFGPEHGIRGDAQAGVHVASSVDRKTGLPVHSLYGAAAEPTADMLAGIELLALDLPDIGCRYWTYLATMSNCLRAAAKQGIPCVVLDRPNPIGGVAVEGNILEREFTSMVGCYPLPMRTGLTLGEAATLVNAEVGADLRVVRVQGWRRGVWQSEMRLPFVPPSPNMPALDTMTLYPGTCLVEGTNLSEGRGTTKPFELIGAPWLDAEALAAHLGGLGLPGVLFRPAYFTPSFSKHSGVRCSGVQVHVLERHEVRAVELGLHILSAARAQSPGDFEWAGAREQQPAFFDLLAGGTRLRNDLEQERDPGSIVDDWVPGLARFRSLSQSALLYE